LASFLCGILGSLRRRKESSGRSDCQQDFPHIRSQVEETVSYQLIHARKSSHSASFSFVMGISFTETTTSWVIGFRLGGRKRKSPG